MGNPPTEDAVAALKIQNDARADKKLAPLNWDDNLSDQATEYAQSLANANNGLQHSSGPHDPPQGENLYAQSAGYNPATAAANSWIGESANYHGEKIGEGDFGSYGHYSESSRRTSCGCLWCDVGKRFANSESSSVHVVQHDEHGDGVCDGVEWVGFCGGEI